MAKDRFPARYATVENSVLEYKESHERLPYVHDQMPGSNLAKFASIKDKPLKEGEDGYLYVRTRAISSRVNKNNDGWPAEELAKGYKTFVGRPIFVDHNNDDPRRTRGVIVDARIHVEDEKTSALDPYYSTAPENHKPATWVELLMEVDAATYPELAKDIRDGKVTATSMGANIEKSICSVCENEAAAPSEYCDHIKSKGATFEIEADNGEKISKKAYEDCYGVNFFEDSFVFDPADETALISEHGDKLAKEAAAPGTNPVNQEDDRQRNHVPQSDLVGAPNEVDTLRDEMLCKNCEADHYAEDSDGISRCPTCGDEMEPQGLDNPDLNKHLRDQADATDETGGENGGAVTFDEVPDGQGSPEDASAAGGDSFITPIQPIKPSASVGVINEMKFETKFETDDKEEMDRLAPVTAATIQTTLPRAGWHNACSEAARQMGLKGTITYDDGTTLDVTDNGNFQKMMQMRKEYKNVNGERPSTNNIFHITADVDNPELFWQIWEQQGAGGERGPDQQAPLGKTAIKKVIKPGGTPAGKPKDEKVISDQLAPVESKLTFEDTEMKEADRRKIIRTEAPDGSKSEEIVEETGDLAFDDSAKDEKPKSEETPKEEPKEEESDDEASADDEVKDEKKDKYPVAASVENSETKLLKAFALADEAVDLGLIAKEEKLTYVAKLEKETLAQIESRRDVHELVKAAGLTKATPKIAGIRSLPRVASISESSNYDLNSIDDAALFL